MPERKNSFDSTSFESDGDAIRLYFKEVGQIKLLSPQEEIELFRRIEKGDKKARMQMVEANLRLVITIAKRYIGRGLSLLDLIQEGNIGLMKAVERFRLGRGAKLSTYGAWWIHQAIKKALFYKSRMIRVPIKGVEQIWAIERTTNKLVDELGRKPSKQEIADDVGISVSRIIQLDGASRCTVSLDDAGKNGDSSSTFGDTIADTSTPSPTDELVKMNLRHVLNGMLNDKLTKREQKIIELRFGLKDGNKRTLEFIALKFELTRERIRQIEVDALHKLRKGFKKIEAQHE